jgi:hypothetical protein
LVHALLSLHGVAFGFAGFEQTPVDGLHVPASWHWSGPAQTTGFAPVHAPLWQVSVCVQALPSLQLSPFAFAGFEQTPVDGLQVPASWHWSDAVQTTGFVPVQVPFWQVSVCVHALASSQLPVTFVNSHRPATHVSAVQGLPSSHAGSPSPHAMQPDTERFAHAPASHVSVVQASPSLQFFGPPDVQMAAWQVSPSVQPSPSVHGVLFGADGFVHVPFCVRHTPGTWH